MTDYSEAAHAAGPITGGHSDTATVGPMTGSTGTLR